MGWMDSGRPGGLLREKEFLDAGDHSPEEGAGCRRDSEKETWDDDSYEFDKCYLKADALSRPQELFDRMKFMEIIDRGNDFYECVPKGHSKAAVIERVLRIYSIPLSEAYVFETAAMTCPCSIRKKLRGDGEAQPGAGSIRYLCNKNSRGRWNCLCSGTVRNY